MTNTLWSLTKKLLLSYMELAFLESLFSFPFVGCFGSRYLSIGQILATARHGTGMPHTVVSSMEYPRLNENTPSQPLHVRLTEIPFKPDKAQGR